MAAASEPPVKIVVLDDDPTGIQTVYGCLLLTGWPPALIRHALADEAPFFYILSNTRALNREHAVARIGEIVRTLLEVNREFGFRLIVINRSDSTLRGHFPADVDAIRHIFRETEGSVFDAVFVIPAFIEGGRLTVGDTHYVVQDGGRVPAAKTEFARDAVFGYRSSNLKEYIVEKSGGGIKPESVRSVGLYELRHKSRQELRRMLEEFGYGRYVIVNAESYADLDRFASAFLDAVRTGRHYLIHGAASIVRSLADLPERPLLTGKTLKLSGGSPGVIIAGSYVQKTTQQIEELLKEPYCEPVEIDITFIPERSADIVNRAVERVATIVGTGKTPLVYTSRWEREFSDRNNRIAAGRDISKVLVAIAARLPEAVSFVVAKGGITSADILKYSLKVDHARVLGQIFPGVPVIRTPANSRYPHLPYVIFPGNVGDRNALRDVVRTLSPDQP